MAQIHPHCQDAGTGVEMLDLGCDEAYSSFMSKRSFITDDVAAEVAALFLPSMGPLSVSRIATGQMQASWGVVCRDGSRYILQEMGSHVGDETGCDRLCLIGEWLREKNFGLSVPACIRSVNGRFSEPFGGRVYRCQERLPDLLSGKRMSAAQAPGMGRALSLFHLVDPDGMPGGRTCRSLNEARDDTENAVRKASFSVRQVAGIMFRWHDLLTVPDLGEGLRHGDPKTDNFLFDDKGPYGVIDFEYAGPGSLATDLGECLRSACGLSGWIPNNPDARLAPLVCDGYGVSSRDGFACMKAALVRQGFSRARYVAAGRGTPDRLFRYMMTVAPFF